MKLGPFWLIEYGYDNQRQYSRGSRRGGGRTPKLYKVKGQAASIAGRFRNGKIVEVWITTEEPKEPEGPKT